MADDFSKPPPNRVAEQNQIPHKYVKPQSDLSAQQAQQRQQQIQSADVTKTRQQAPGAIQSGSEQEAFVRQEAAKAESQKLVEGAYGSGSSKDQYAGAREAALKAGSFSYSVQSPSSLPSTVNKKGETTTRSQELYHGSPTDLKTISGKTSVPNEQTVTIKTPTGSRTITGEQALVERLQSNYLSSTTPQKQTVTKQTQQLKPQPDKTTSILLQNIINKEKQAVSDISGKTEKEAVPFLSLESPIKISVVSSTPRPGETKSRGRGATPGTGQHVEIILPQHEGQGTKEIPYTSILDTLQFAPIGGLGLPKIGTAIKESGSIIGTVKASSGVFKGSEGLERVSEKTITVPRGIKPPEETLLGKIQSTFSKPEPKQQAKPSEIQVNLGRGTGKLISKGDKGGFESSKPGGGTKPGNAGTPKESTSRSGQVLQQIEREKEPKTTTKTETKTEQINKALGKEKEETKPTTTKSKSKLKSETTEEQIPIMLTRTTSKPKPKETSPLIPFTVPVPPQPKTKPKPQETLFITDLLTVTKQTPKQKPTEDITSITDTTSAQVTKPQQKQAPEGVSLSDILYTEKGSGESKLPSGGVGSNPGLIGKVTSGGTKKNFLGNVPLDDIIGIGKQEEITYKESTIKTRTASEERRASTGSFIGGSSQGKKKLF